MDIPRYTALLKKKIEEADAHIELRSNPIFEQKPTVLHHEWSLHFVSGNPQYDYGAFRDFKFRIQQQFGDQVQILPFLVNGIDEAYQFIHGLQDLLPDEASGHFHPKDIQESDFTPDEPVYVVIVERTIYSYI
ncbi:hypothetical protein [Chitinophaga tropicalis]|uniref:Uncharacterized protein n=1 Tax=Chitinophaga tropicalis TaxID=2683588 RepID=A0A7K1TZX0_9BACT|nr:hypothetical protein [Chitinophaga tropicalis]MVT07658.1 hypothetical protein [Chitinophaga tropicalis]